MSFICQICCPQNFGSLSQVYIDYTHNIMCCFTKLCNCVWNDIYICNPTRNMLIPGIIRTDIKRSKCLQTIFVKTGLGRSKLIVCFVSRICHIILCAILKTLHRPPWKAQRQGATINHLGVVKKKMFTKIRTTPND